MGWFIFGENEEVKEAAEELKEEIAETEEVDLSEEESN